MSRVDAHCHFWKLDRGDYNWLDIKNPKLFRIAQDFFPSDLTELREKTGASQVVAVQAAATEAETDFLLKLADENPEIAGVVGWVDLASSDAENSIEKFSTNSKFKGVRPMLQDIGSTRWLLEVPKYTLWDMMSQKGLRFDALIKPHHLSVTHEFCLRNSSLPVVIDHAAKPDLASNDKDRMDAWRKGMSGIGRHTHAYCKISGLLTELNAEQREDPVTVLQPIVDDLIEWFGPSRLMWGSDWPVLRMASDYGIWDEITQELLNKLSLEDRNLILGGTAASFYGLEAKLA